MSSLFWTEHESLAFSHLWVCLLLQDLVNWIQDKQEVEIVDLVLRIREKLASTATNEIPVSADTVNKLECHMTSIISTLPEDLQAVLKDGQC